MRIHKFVLMLITFFMIGIATVNAQKVESRSQFIKIEKTSHPHPMEWFVRAGGGITVNSAYNIYNGDTFANYNIAIGFKRYFGNEPQSLYWGAMLGSTLYGYDDINWFDESYSTDIKPSFYLGPQIGYNLPLTKTLKFDIHLMAAYQISLDGGYYEKLHHLMGQFGVGLWIKRFLIGIDYQPSFINLRGSIKHSVMLNIGFRF